jgi:Leucine-rich repeat (LRR) protein
VSTQNVKPERRWYQFYLWHLFVLVTLVAIGCAWLRCRMLEAERQRAAVEAIGRAGAAVFYDYHVVADDKKLELDGNSKPGVPAWLCESLGSDFLYDVVAVSTGLTSLLSGPSRLGDEQLEHLQGLPGLRVLDLSYSQVSDAGLVHLDGLARLEQVDLSHTRITDAGLEHLVGLPSLRQVNVEHANVTDEGIERFRRTVPKCEICQ